MGGFSCFLFLIYFLPPLYFRDLLVLLEKPAHQDLLAKEYV